MKTDSTLGIYWQEFFFYTISQVGKHNWPAVGFTVDQTRYSGVLCIHTSVVVCVTTQRLYEPPLKDIVVVLVSMKPPSWGGCHCLICHITSLTNVSQLCEIHCAWLLILQTSMSFAHLLLHNGTHMHI